VSTVFLQEKKRTGGARRGRRDLRRISFYRRRREREGRGEDEGRKKICDGRSVFVT
jgi:hypothetical protein